MEELGTANRRHFLCSTGAFALGASIASTTGSASASGVMKAGSKPWRGLFPIIQTPFTQDDKVDLDCLAAEIKFCNRGGVPGALWPQSSSSWLTLSEQERFAGAEAILASGKGGNTSLIIGVQSKTRDLNEVKRYIQHAARNGADGIVSMAPGEENNQDNVSHREILDYFKAIGAMSDLPIMVQSYGKMDEDLLVQIYKEVPTVKAVKDETGNPLLRIKTLKERTDGKYLVFLAHGATEMLNGLRLNFDGYIPKAGLADLSQQVFEWWNAGKHREAFDLFGRVQAFQSITGAMQYILTARGVFKETTTIRDADRMFGAKGRTPDMAQREIIRRELKEFLGPYLRA